MTRKRKRRFEHLADDDEGNYSTCLIKMPLSHVAGAQSAVTQNFIRIFLMSDDKNNYSYEWP